MPGAVEVGLEQPGHRDVLGEDQHRAVLGQDGGEQLVEQVELLRAAGQPHRAGLLEEVGRVVADLLEPGEQREHQAAPGLLVGALDALHRVADERLVEHHLLAGQPERVVGLGLRRQLGRDAGSDLRRRSRNGPIRSANCRALVGSCTPDSMGAAQTLRKALRLPSRPGIAQSRIAQSSVRLFSTGVPVRATRAGAGDRAQGAGRGGAGVLHVLRLVGDDQAPRDLAQPRSRASRVVAGAACRTSSARSPGRCRAARARGRPASAGRRGSGAPACPGANRSISASQLPSSEAGQTTSVGPGGRVAAPAGAGAGRSG